MTKPLIVYVSGAPGSGKTTLARLIAEQLYVPNISSDLVHGGVALVKPDHSREQTLLEIFVPTMIDMAEKGISFVVDQVLQAGISEADIIDRLRTHARLVNIHTMCASPIERYTARVKASSLPSVLERREHLLGLAAGFEANLARTRDPLELGVPLLVVNTDDGYEPGVAEVIAFIRDQI